MAGKDYIGNEAGRTTFPKWVDHPTQIEFKTADGKEVKKKVLVASPEEEKKLLGGKASASPEGWVNPAA